MLLYIHGKFTVGCRYCLNVVIHTRKVHNGMQVLPECCYRYMESSQWDAGTVCMLLCIHGKFTMGCRYCLNVVIHTRKVHNGMQVLPEYCYTYTESSQQDAGTAWMLLYIHGKFTTGCRYCLNVVIHTWKFHNRMQVLPECCYTYTESSQWDAGTAFMLLCIHGKFTMGCRYFLNVVIHTRKVHSGRQVLYACCYAYTESSQWDAGTAWMLLYIHGKFTMGCRYCLNIVIHTRKVHNRMQVLPECCYTYMESSQQDAGTAWMLLYIHGNFTTGCRHCLNVAIHTRKVHSGMQLLPECCYAYTKVHNGMQLLPECCYTYMKSSQWDAGTAWMLLCMHGKFTMGCRYCLNVAIHTRKVYHGMQVLPKCCYIYTESSQWDAATAWMLLYIHGKFTMGCRYCLNVVIDTWKVHSGMQVLYACCYAYTESSQWDAGTAWMLLYIHGKFTMGCRYCLNIVIHTRKVHNRMQVLPECCYTYMESSQQDAGTAWMLLYIHGNFTTGCRYCLNVAIHTRKVHSGMQVLHACCYAYTESSQWDAGTSWMLLYIHGKFTVGGRYCMHVAMHTRKFTMGCSYCLNVAIHTWKVHNGMQVLPECCYTYMESSQWDAGTAWMLLCMHGKFTMGCRYCLNVAIHTWKVHNGMQVLPECCYTYTESSQWDAGTAWILLYIHGKFTTGCRYCLNVVINTWKVHNRMQVLPECCYTYMEISQQDAGTAWMLLFIHGKFTVGCRYCLNVAIYTWKIHNGMQVLPECCYTYTESSQWDPVTAWMLLCIHESSQWDAVTAWMLLYIHGKFTMGCRYCLNVVIHTWKVHNGMQVLPECCYACTESLQWDAGTAWMLLYIHGKFTMGCRYCLNVAIYTRKVHSGMQVLPECCYTYTESSQWDAGTAWMLL